MLTRGYGKDKPQLHQVTLVRATNFNSIIDPCYVPIFSDFLRFLYTLTKIPVTANRIVSKKFFFSDRSMFKYIHVQFKCVAISCIYINRPTSVPVGLTDESKLISIIK